jgi:1-acyl-sn-glycerol-3-phosphate acyltransferase
LRRVGDWLFAAYAWTLLVLMALAMLVAVTALPQPARRRHVATILAHTFVRASGLPVQVTGDEHFPPAGPITVVANHASYIDGIVLLAVVPERCVFVAKKELAESFVLRHFLRDIGTRFVERFDVEGGVEAAPDGGDWTAAIRLRDRARAAILAACGEPDLA